MHILCPSHVFAIAKSNAVLSASYAVCLQYGLSQTPLHFFLIACRFTLLLHVTILLCVDWNVRTSKTPISFNTVLTSWARLWPLYFTDSMTGIWNKKRKIFICEWVFILALCLKICYLWEHVYFSFVLCTCSEQAMDIFCVCKPHYRKLSYHFDSQFMSGLFFVSSNRGTFHNQLVSILVLLNFSW